MAVGYQRGDVMSAACVHFILIGSNVATLWWPTWGESPPPIARTRPSNRTTWAPQWKLLVAGGKGLGVLVSCAVTGSHTRASSPARQKRTLPVRMSTWCVAGTPKSRTGPHWPA